MSDADVFGLFLSVIILTMFALAGAFMAWIDHLSRMEQQRRTQAARSTPFRGSLESKLPYLVLLSLIDLFHTMIEMASTSRRLALHRHYRRDRALLSPADWDEIIPADWDEIASRRRTYIDAGVEEPPEALYPGDYY